MSSTYLTSPAPIPAASTPGRFGKYGGRYVPETLMAALLELEHAYAEAQKDEAFQAELASLLHDYCGRPTPLYFAKRLSETLGGAKIYLKREDLLHTGAHKINNALGQALLARRMGKQRIIAETGAGQHGVATATVCALFGMECVVYMGEEDMRRQELNVFRMRLLGAEVRGVSSGSATLKDAINEAMRDWVTNVRDTFYILGSALGAHPYPTMVRDFHRVISRESKRQILEHEGRLPDAIVACVGGGSNAIGAFYEYIPDAERRAHRRRSRRPRDCTRRTRRAVLWRVSPACCKAPTATSSRTTPARSRRRTPSPPASTTPASAPSTPCCTTTGRARYTSATDTEALEATKLLSRTEGIIPALESAHAIAEAIKLAPKMGSDKILMVNVSGRGDKDMGILTRELHLGGDPADNRGHAMSNKLIRKCLLHRL